MQNLYKFGSIEAKIWVGFNRFESEYGSTLTKRSLKKILAFNWWNWYTLGNLSLAWVKYSNPGADFPCAVETVSTGSNPVLNVRINKNNF
jgi:hypothetical protein